MSAMAFFGPMPVIPGRLSAPSPTNAEYSLQRSGVTLCFAVTDSHVVTVGAPRRSVIWFAGSRSWYRSLSPDEIIAVREE